jgi:hypothetical protein
MTRDGLRSQLDAMLVANVGSGDLLEIVSTFASEGGEQPVAQAIVEELLRKYYDDEPRYDVIFDVADVVTGFCSLHRRIWR